LFILSCNQSRSGPSPNPTRAYFRPTVNKEQAVFDADIFLAQRKKSEKFDIFGGNFPDPEVADPTRPEQQINGPARVKNHSC